MSERIVESAVPLPAKAPRYAFVDLLRGFALVMMIETHVCNAYLPFALKKGSEFFFWLSFVNGLVAPAFLFASGFSIVLQSNSQWEIGCDSACLFGSRCAPWFYHPCSLLHAFGRASG